MPTGSQILAAAQVTIGGDPGVLAIGGYNGGYLALAQFFDAATLAWSSEPSLSGGLETTAVPLVLGGTTGVLITGGSAGGLYSAGVQWFCP